MKTFVSLLALLVFTGCSDEAMLISPEPSPDGEAILSGTASKAGVDAANNASSNAIEVVIRKNVGFVLNGIGCGPIPELKSTVQIKNGDIHMWTVLYQAPEGCPFVPDKGVRRDVLSYAGNAGTLTTTSSGRMISKFVSNRGF